MKSTISKTDQDLLNGLRSSDQVAVKSIYDLVLPTIIIWIRKNNGTEADARDVFQEALIALFQKMQKGEFELTCTLKSYLRVVCRNIWLARIRNKGFNSPQLSEEDELVDLDEDMEKRIQLAERQQLFFKYFDQLDEKCQHILKGYFDSVPFKVLAEELDTSEGYVKKRKFSCKEKLIGWIKADPVYRELQGFD